MQRGSVIPSGTRKRRERSQGRSTGAATRAPRARGTHPSALARAWRKAGAGVVLGCAALLATGCASAGGPATTPAQPSQAALAAQALSPAQRRAVARSYLAIARPANRRLNADFDGLEYDDRHDLAAAKADLRDAAATERLFDRRLLALNLPPPTETVARLLVAANQARIRLTVAAAASTLLSQLRRYEPRLTAANGPVEQAARVIRSQLDLPPPETS